MSLSVIADHGAPSISIARGFPLTKPNAPKLSAYVADLAGIEESHWLTNYGPTNQRLEASLLANVFDGEGRCLTVCNATLGLMIALKFAAESRMAPAGSFVIMPSFTFAAAAHAVLWAGLTPLLVDIDPDDWTASLEEVERLLQKHGSAVAALMPYATFGSCIDLTRYDRLSELYDVPVVVDAAASLGTLDLKGYAFGRASRHTIVFSMHATKAFGVGECGLIYSADTEKIDVLRRMGNFGFDTQRSATVAGLNSKISEIVALTALIKLSDYKAQILHRSELAQLYMSELAGWAPQRTSGSLVAYQFMPFLLPTELRPMRRTLCDRLKERGIGVGQYFSPHIYEQPYFRERCIADVLGVTNEIANGIVSLPISDFLSIDDILQICAEVRAIEEELLGRGTWDANVGGGQCSLSVTAL